MRADGAVTASCRCRCRWWWFTLDTRSSQDPNLVTKPFHAKTRRLYVLDRGGILLIADLFLWLLAVSEGRLHAAGSHLMMGHSSCQLARGWATEAARPGRTTFCSSSCWWGTVTSGRARSWRACRTEPPSPPTDTTWVSKWVWRGGRLVNRNPPVGSFLEVLRTDFLFLRTVYAKQF